jgi:hypothetical protein
MKVTNVLRSDIKSAIRRFGECKRGKGEVGLRGEDWQPNSLLWTNDDDLQETLELDKLKEINDDPENPGCAMLDVYVYEHGNGPDQVELQTNVYVFIRDGKVVGATGCGGGYEKFEHLRARLNFPETRGW